MNNHAERIILKRETEVGWGEIREKEQTNASERIIVRDLELNTLETRCERKTSTICCINIICFYSSESSHFENSPNL